MKKHKKVPIRSFEELSKVIPYENTNQRDEEIIIDYDDLTYIRMMKLFAPSNSIFGENEFYDSINLDEYYKSDPNVKNIQVDMKEIKKKILEPFHLRYYFPKDAILRREKKIKHLIVMFNGMDEKEQFLLYDNLGEYFANSGFAAVLIPTPLHLNRKFVLESDTDISLTPTRIALNKHYRRENKLSITEYKNSSLFFYHYFKSWLELQELTKKVTNEKDEKTGKHYWEELKNNIDTSNLDKNNRYLIDKAFYELYFGVKEDKKNEIKISILGYSLGGLRALGFFINDCSQEKNKHISKYHSCITINTGPDLGKALTNTLGISDDDWSDLMKSAKSNSLKINLGTKNENLRTLKDVFLNLYFPEENVSGKFELNSLFKKRLSDNINSYLAITSGSDDVVNPSQIDKIAPDFKSIHKITVAGVNHLPSIDPNWQDLLPRIENHMVEFINSCKEVHYTKNEILAQIAVVVLETPAFHFFNDELIKEKGNTIEEIKQLEPHLLYDFDLDDMQKLLNDIEKNIENEQIKLDTNITHRFLKYYFLSKAFFPHFAQVINEINKEIISKLKSDLNDKNMRNRLSQSEIAFEMIKIYVKKENYPSDYLKLFKNCRSVLERLQKENKQHSELKEDDKGRHPFSVMKNRLSKIGISGEKLNEIIKT